MARTKQNQIEAEQLATPLDVLAVAGVYAFHRCIRKPFTPVFEHPDKEVAYELQLLDENTLQVKRTENSRSHQAYRDALQRMQVEIAPLVRTKNSILSAIKKNLEVIDEIDEQLQIAPNDEKLAFTKREAQIVIANQEKELKEVETVIADKSQTVPNKPSDFSSVVYTVDLSEMF